MFWMADVELVNVGLVAQHLFWLAVNDELVKIGAGTHVLDGRC